MHTEEEPPTRTAVQSADSDFLSDGLFSRCPLVMKDGRCLPLLGGIMITGRLGQGGMGVVYRGRHPRLQIDVAVKVLPTTLEQSDPQFAERFEREARIAARVRSEHLVSVLDVDSDPASGCRFLVMELVEGTTGARWLREASSGRVGVRERDALDLCIAASRGLAAAHAAGVIHRDVKPGNVLIPIGADGRPDLAAAKLSDLGLARPDRGEQSLGEQSLTGTDTPLGTPGYMAPEQVRGAKSAGRPADVFGLGATLYALLAGQSPFRADTPVDALLRTVAGEYPAIETVRPDVSSATAALVARCLRPEPAERFADADALVEALEVCRKALGAGSLDGGQAAVQVTSLGRSAAETPSGPQTPRLAPEPSRPTATLPPVRGSGRGAIAAVAIAAVAGVVAFVAWPDSDRKQPALRAAAPAKLPAPVVDPTAPPPPGWGVAPRPREKTPPVDTETATKDAEPVAVAQPAPAAQPATPEPAPVVRKSPTRSPIRLPQPELVGAPVQQAVAGNAAPADAGASAEFDLSGLAEHEESFGAKEIRRLVAQFRDGDLAAAAEIHRKLSQFYLRFDDPERARTARDRAAAIERTISARAAEQQRAPAGGAQPADRTPPPPPPPPPPGAPPRKGPPPR